MDAHENIRTPRFCGVAQAAKRLGVSRMTLYRLIADGEFPAVKIRSRILIPLSALEEVERRAIETHAAIDAKTASKSFDYPLWDRHSTSH